MKPTNLCFKHLNIASSRNPDHFQIFFFADDIKRLRSY